MNAFEVLFWIRAAALLARIFTDGPDWLWLCLGGVLSALLGWTLEFHASLWTLGGTLVLGVLAGGMASVLAAWRSAKVQITEALVTY
jgi:ABC-type antimicrobial peptide transport system permease subunit